MSGARSVRAVTVAAMFGLLRADGRGPGRGGWAPARLAAALDAGLGAGQVALVRGPSGSGKSRLLAALARRAERAGMVVTLPALDPAHAGAAAPVDLVDLPLSGALRLLARAGLADARALVRPARELSEGERWRLRLAMAMLRLQRVAPGGARPPLLVVDEFCSVLDRASARSVAHTLARWVRADARARLACATAHDDLLGALAPDLVVSCAPGRPARLDRAGPPDRAAA